MRYFFSLLLCLCLCSPVCAAERQFVATVFPVWLLLRQIVQDVPHVHAELLLPAGTGCPHDYTMTPQDRRTLARADVLIMNGLGLENFLGERSNIHTLLKANARIIDISSQIPELLPVKDDDDDQATHRQGHRQHTNPHIFASPSMMASMAKALAKQLSELDPQYAEIYTFNGHHTAQIFQNLLNEQKEAISSLHGKNILTQHGVFDYLARDLGITVAGTIQSHEGQEPSARDMLDLVKLIKEKNISAIITEPQYPARTGKTLSAETGIPCILLDPIATGPADATLDYYLSTMRANIHILEQTFGTR